MQEHFTNLRATRKNIALVIKGLSQEQFNKIPDGFNNNIAWNFGHIIVTQQLLVYALSGAKTIIPTDIINLYRKGTSPTTPVTQEQIDELKSYLDSAIDQTEKDLAAGVFGDYKEYPTSYGITLHNLEEAIIFNNMHEAMHLGYIMAMKRALG
ncbi:MAG: DinB family protein [Bacteroidetes bacterium]|nr:MAG: DinB family protein [Bacteroidota bacterium]